MAYKTQQLTVYVSLHVCIPACYTYTDEPAGNILTGAGGMQRVKEGPDYMYN